MILGADIGNSSIGFCGMEAGSGQIRFQSRMDTHPLQTVERYAEELRRLLRPFSGALEPVEGSIVSSVVPAATQPVCAALTALTGTPPLLVTPDLHTDLNMESAPNTVVGADLIAAACAAIHWHPLPAIVVDMGTATTVMAVDGARYLRGGGILPGVRVSMQSLLGATAQLDCVPLEAPGHAIGRTTAECIQSGILYGAAGAIDGLITRIEEELGTSATLIATGGMAPRIIPLCRHKLLWEPDLLLKGLSLLYAQNRL